MNEYLLSVDEYNRPKVLKKDDAICNLLIRLMLLNPGEITSHPDMGVGIIKNWRYRSTDDLADLKQRIEEQIRTYLPLFQTVEVDVHVDANINVNKTVYISITVDDKMYKYTLSKSSLLPLTNQNNN